MNTLAVILNEPRVLTIGQVELLPAGAQDVVVAVEASGISTGTERLLWSGRMPPFPGLGYPLVPGYESIGTVIDAGTDQPLAVGDRVFVPGSKGFVDVRGLFGGAAARLVVSGARAVRLPDSMGDEAILLALAATAHHALAAPDARPPGLIIGHGVLGRLLARVALALGHPAPLVWETNPGRRQGATGYAVCDPADDATTGHGAIYDVSGDASVLDQLIPRLARGGEIVLAGFYEAPIRFAFPPAFMREARLRIAAEWQPSDLAGVLSLIAAGALSLDHLITHRVSALDAANAYRTAFEDASCLKMVLDWRTAA